MNIPPIPPPSRDDIARIGESYRLRLSAADAESFRALVTRSLASHHAVERLYAERIAETPVRAWQWPAADANPLGGWYVTASVSTWSRARSPGGGSRSRTTSRSRACR
jgi:hypothetical protein